MKFIALILLSFFSFSCSQSKKKSNNSEKITNVDKVENYGNELIESNFLKYANQLKLDSLKSEIKGSFYIYDEEIYKFAHIDAEELSEFSFDFFLPQLNKILEKRNMNIIVETADDYERTFDIIINGEKINLYSNEQLENGAFWESASRNFFRKVNKILKSKNSNEQFYLLYGGNDLATLLLTEEQFKLIRDKYENEPNEIPYKP